MAFSILERKDVVFGPTSDGGYYLVGMKTPHIQVFHKQSYGHDKVLKNTSNINFCIVMRQLWMALICHIANVSFYVKFFLCVLHTL